MIPWYRLYRIIGRGLALFLSHKSGARQGHLPGPVDLWVHASSVGEATVAAAILTKFRKLQPQARILLTLFTETGLTKAQELLKETDVRTSLAPYDLPAFVTRALEKARPRVLALVETELWPNLISLAREKGIRVVLLNGRLSARSFPRYRLLRGLFRPLLQGLSGLAVIGPREAERFQALGAPPERLQILGNAKHDLVWQRARSWDATPLRRHLRLGEERVLVFGSVRTGEEDPVVQVIKALWPRDDLRFVVVPRHLHHLDRWERTLAEAGLPWERWTTLKQGMKGRLLLVDAIGPLFGLYSLAYAAFVGGSLVPKGGQNPMEPAAFGVPVLFGPYMENFENEKRALLQTGGGLVARGARELTLLLEELLNRKELYRQAAQGASKALEGLIGAAQKQAAWLARFL